MDQCIGASSRYSRPALVGRGQDKPVVLAVVCVDRGQGRRDLRRRRPFWRHRLGLPLGLFTAFRRRVDIERIALDKPWRGPDGSRPATRILPARLILAIVADQAEWSRLYEREAAPAQPPKGRTVGGIEAVESTMLENMRVAATTQSMNGCG